jgi:hypothetical protein
MENKTSERVWRSFNPTITKVLPKLQETTVVYGIQSPFIPFSFRK